MNRRNADFTWPCATQVGVAKKPYFMFLAVKKLSVDWENRNQRKFNNEHIYAFLHLWSVPAQIYIYASSLLSICLPFNRNEAKKIKFSAFEINA